MELFPVDQLISHIGILAMLLLALAMGTRSPGSVGLSLIILPISLSVIIISGLPERIETAVKAGGDLNRGQLAVFPVLTIGLFLYVHFKSLEKIFLIKPFLIAMAMLGVIDRVHSLVMAHYIDTLNLCIVIPLSTLIRGSGFVVGAAIVLISNLNIKRGPCLPYAFFFSAGHSFLLALQTGLWPFQTIVVYSLATFYGYFQFINTTLIELQKASGKKGVYDIANNILKLFLLQGIMDFAVISSFHNWMVTSLSALLVIYFIELAINSHFYFEQSNRN